MNELQIKTDVDMVIDRIDAAMVETLAHTHAATQALNDGYAALWGAPDDVILGILERWGPLKVQQVMATHYQAGTAYNAILDARPDASRPTRAIVVAGRVVHYDQATGQWSMEPVVVPEPEPEPGI